METGDLEAGPNIEGGPAPESGPPWLQHLPAEIGRQDEHSRLFFTQMHLTQRAPSLLQRQDHAIFTQTFVVASECSFCSLKLYMLMRQVLFHLQAFHLCVRLRARDLHDLLKSSTIKTIRLKHRRVQESSPTSLVIECLQCP